MCGEHLSESHKGKPSPGSSPHVRGARVRVFADGLDGGIIPACAGSTCFLFALTPDPWDHPRMCGEHATVVYEVIALQGSSPHVRGARRSPAIYRRCAGIIPACAGSTVTPDSVTLVYRDHPRMCGEHPSMSMVLPLTEGSSPHVRGAPWSTSCGTTPRGIIPACAGSTGYETARRKFERDHPRMCGEHDVCVMARVLATGSSPHVRGALPTW